VLSVAVNTITSPDTLVSAQQGPDEHDHGDVADG